ncbi:MAG: hypothetical protein JSV50_23225 [Desulfobacteraceae bacterium]|nr:MAG: hypothetical protein JSV50_23225 [Desulfobacteraceae bacterium]
MRTTVAKECFLWGCPGLSFKAKLPFDGMRLAASSIRPELMAEGSRAAGFCGLSERDTRGSFCLSAYGHAQAGTVFKALN